MRSAIILSLTLALAAPAMSQTAGDVFTSEGLKGFSNSQQAIGEALLRAGVPEDCLLQLTMNSVRQISAIVATGEETDREIKTQIERILANTCGELDLN